MAGNGQGGQCLPCSSGSMQMSAQQKSWVLLTW